MLTNSLCLEERFWSTLLALVMLIIVNFVNKGTHPFKLK